MAYLTGAVGGVYIRDGHTATVNVTLTNTWNNVIVPVSTVLLPISDSRDWLVDFDNGKLTYAAGKKAGMIAYNVTSFSNKKDTMIDIGLFKNGIICPHTRGSTLLKTIGESWPISIVGMTSLNIGDFFEPVIKTNVVATLTIVHFSIAILL